MTTSNSDLAHGTFMVSRETWVPQSHINALKSVKGVESRAPRFVTAA
jgi:hypothetical protein